MHTVGSRGALVMPRSGGSAKKAKVPAKAEKKAGKAKKVKEKKQPVRVGKSSVKAAPLEITELRRANDVSPRLGYSSFLLWGTRTRTRTRTRTERGRERGRERERERERERKTGRELLWTPHDLVGMLPRPPIRRQPCGRTLAYARQAARSQPPSTAVASCTDDDGCWCAGARSGACA